MRRKALIALIVLLTALISWQYAHGQADDTETAHRYLERARELYKQSRYDSLPWYYGQARTMYRSTGNHDGIAECLLGLVDYHRLTNDFYSSKAYLDTARAHITESRGKDSHAWSEYKYVEAKLYYSSGDLSAALKSIEDCLVLRLRLKEDPEKIARARNILGSVHYYQGDYENAERYFLLAYEYYCQLSDEPSVEKGRLQLNLSYIHSRREEMDKWMGYLKKAIENNIEVYGEDFADLGNNYSGLASYYITGGRMDSAEYYLDRAEEIFLKAYGPGSQNLDQIYTNRARLLRWEGNFYSALEYYDEVEKLQSRNSASDNIHAHNRWINTAYLYQMLKDYGKAQEYYDR